MRIGYLSESMGWSGGAQQLLWMAKALQAMGEEVTLIIQPGSDLVARAKEAGLPVRLLRMRQDYDVPAAWRLARIVRDLRLDVLHAQHSTAHAIGLMATLWANFPVYAVTRRVIFPIKKNLFSRLKYLSSRIRGYVAISDAVKVELLKAGIDAERIAVIPSVVDYRAAPADEGANVRAEFAIPASAPLFLMVSNYADFKGHEYFVRAAAEIQRDYPQAHYLIAGRLTEQLQPLVDQLGLSSTVHLAGFRTDVPRLHAAASFYVMPSLQEAAGTALREAMMAGLPAIGTRVGGIPESIDDGVTGLLVPSADTVALAQAMRRFLMHPEEARRCAQAGQASIRERFTLEPAAHRMKEFYAKLLSHIALSSR